MVRPSQHLMHSTDIRLQGTHSAMLANHRPAICRSHEIRGLRHSAAPSSATVAVSLILLICTAGGCASTNWVNVREVPRNPLSDRLNLMARGGPKPTERTMQFLRRYNLTAELSQEPKQQLQDIQEVLNRDPSPEGCQAFAELAYIGGVKLESSGKPEAAVDLYGASVAHAYKFLFDPCFAQFRNPYDPIYREACDLYNGALESSLRIVKKHGQLRPGAHHSIELAGHTWDIEVIVRNGPWKDDEFDRFEFVSDYEITGLQNRYHNYGLGVPLIAVHKKSAEGRPTDRYLPPVLSFPMTAFLRVDDDNKTVQEGEVKKHRAVIELFDPLTATDIEVCNRRVPLETDLSTPLAFFLNDPEFAKIDLSTTGLLRPEEASEKTGLYMVEPYRPDKIPVLFVHGLWSSPITWMEMFNDLQGQRELRDNYQFWFYLYPTGQPFWISGTGMREDLAKLRNLVDPRNQLPAMDQMVLVGHSMGGLVSRMQTLDSRNDFWNLVSDKPFQLVKADITARTDLEKTFFFHPNRAVKRVVTIGTPHRGSSFASSTTRYVGNKLITLPAMFTQRKQQLLEENKDILKTDSKLFTISTSIDSLDPESPLLPAMLAAHRAPWTHYHNVVGRLPRKGLNRLAADGDGIVEFSSASLEDVESQIVVQADHVNVHRHPLAVLEVRRILLQHLNELRAAPRVPVDDGQPRTAANWQTVGPYQGLGQSGEFFQGNSAPKTGHPLTGHPQAGPAMTSSETSGTAPLQSTAGAPVVVTPGQYQPPISPQFDPQYTSPFNSAPPLSR
ncbi:MAG: alpha/beta fold hydrolase [Planctomycetota bacterium]|nr:alpha/beta fold hydrolase [Planctomycetota bacterium]